ncbi:MAG: DUF917 domain-containing protein [Pseudomonadales bacterium]
MKELDRDELKDLLHGCALMGTGGGGDVSTGMRYIDSALAAGKVFRLASANELGSDTMLCTPYALGATQASQRGAEHQRLPRPTQAPIVTAMEKLAAHTGAKFDATVACELGGENTAVAAYAAAMIDGVLLDADAAGRAVPEITHSTYYLAGLPASPLVLSNEFGETILCEQIFDDLRAEDIARAFAMVSRDDIVAVDHAANLSEMSNALYHGSLSMAAQLGCAMRTMRQESEQDTSELAAMGSGKLLLQGVITACEARVESGFTLGFVEVSGTDSYRGDTARIEFKNENMTASINGELRVTIPDLICVLNTQSNEALTHPNAECGMKIAVLVLPAPPHFTSPAGLKAFGPAYLGLDQDFIPAV